VFAFAIARRRPNVLSKPVEPGSLAAKAGARRKK
jgi:hypothetical protein